MLILRHLSLNLVNCFLFCANVVADGISSKRASHLNEGYKNVGLLLFGLFVCFSFYKWVFMKIEITVLRESINRFPITSYTIEVIQPQHKQLKEDIKASLRNIVRMKEDVINWKKKNLQDRKKRNVINRCKLVKIKQLKILYGGVKACLEDKTYLSLLQRSYQTEIPFFCILFQALTGEAQDEWRPPHHLLIAQLFSRLPQ